MAGVVVALRFRWWVGDGVCVCGVTTTTFDRAFTQKGIADTRRGAKSQLTLPLAAFAQVRACGRFSCIRRFPCSPLVASLVVDTFNRHGYATNAATFGERVWQGKLRGHRMGTG